MDFLQTTLTLALLLVGYLITIVTYRLLFHPLSRFPGPKLAASTRLYEFWYDIYPYSGTFSTHLLALHKQYGPIIRINPFEVHILASNFYYELYNFNPELDKRPMPMDNLQNSALFETHRMRRKAMDPYFSRAAIQRLEPYIKSKVNDLCDRLSESLSMGTAVDVSFMYRCMTCDIICDYCLGQPFHLMDDPHTNGAFVKSFPTAFKILLPIREFPWMAWAMFYMQKLPKWLQFAPSDKHMAYMQRWEQDLGPRVQKIRNGTLELDPALAHMPVMFQRYLEDEKLPSDERSESRIQGNVRMLVAAGLETTGFALSMATFQILTHQDVLQRLRVEIDSVWPTNDNSILPSWATLEKLPYLTAVLKESLRLSVGVASRLHRINNRRPTQYRDWSIPPGTSISMNQSFVLYDEAIFPNARRFDPERWLRNKQLDKWFVPFSKGARGCIGERLAWAEMYLTLAAIVRRFDSLALYETTEEHVYPKYDYFVPFPAKEDGVRVIMKQ